MCQLTYHHALGKCLNLYVLYCTKLFWFVINLPNIFILAGFFQVYNTVATLVQLFMIIFSWNATFFVKFMKILSREKKLVWYWVY